MSTVNKVMTAAEAISKFVNDGDVITCGGFVTNRRPYALVREVIKQGKKNLILESGPGGGDQDMLIGAGLVDVLIESYMANSGYTQVSRRMRKFIEEGKILYDDVSLDIHTITFHGAALGMSYVAVKNHLGSGMVDFVGISEEERKKYPKLPPKKYVIQEDPFNPGQKLCLIPTPKIDVALIHCQWASPDGTARIVGPAFQCLDIATAAKHTIVTCEELVDDEVIRRNPELNNLPGFVVDAVVHAPYGAHPSQCFGYYDYDGMFFRDYDKVSKDDDLFQEFLKEYIYDLEDHYAYLDKIGAARLLKLRVQPGKGYVHGLKRK